MRRILGLVGGDRLDGVTFSDRRRCGGAASRCSGPLILAVILFLVFQAVFAWAQVPMDAIKLGVAAFGNWLAAALPASLLKDLLINGVLAGVGSVLVFLPQIIILFFFILVLEDSGYLPRAAFLLDRVMGSVGLSGRAFIPLLSSFACAIPGHHGDAHHPESPRPVGDHHDRAADDLFRAPAGVRADHRRLHSRGARCGAAWNCRAWCCSRCTSSVWSSAMAVAFVLKRSGQRRGFQALMLELPAYHWPNLRNLAHRPVAAGRDFHEPRRHHHSRR